MRSFIKFLGTFLLMFLVAGMIACGGGGGGGGTTPTVISVSGVSVTPETSTILTGHSVQLSALVSPSGATNKAVTWTSNNESVATVDSNGLVTADSTNTGIATITATTADGGFTDTCTVTVTATAVHVTSISVTPETKSINVGEEFTAEVAFTPSDTTDTGITWSTSSSSIATVSNGIVTGVAAGTATITATSTYSGTITDTCVVTVSDSGISGTYDVTLDFGEETDTDTWIIQQSGNNVTFVYGDIPDNDPGMTASGSNLVFNWAWTEEEDGEEISYTLTGSLPISGTTISGTLTLTYGTDSSPVTVTMTRTSTSIEIPVFEIPEAVITVDGTVTDWAGVSTYITDAAGDSEITGTDIRTIKLARDGTRVYGLFQMDAAFPVDYQIYMDFDVSIGRNVEVYARHETDDSWGIYAIDGEGTPISGFSGTITASGSNIEFSFVYSGVIDLATNLMVEAGIGYNEESDEDYDEADFFGYTVLPSLD